KGGKRAVKREKDREAQAEEHREERRRVGEWWWTYFAALCLWWKSFKCLNLGKRRRPQASYLNNDLPILGIHSTQYHNSWEKRDGDIKRYLVQHRRAAIPVTRVRWTASGQGENSRDPGGPRHLLHSLPMCPANLYSYSLLIKAQPKHHKPVAYPCISSASFKSRARHTTHTLPISVIPLPLFDIRLPTQPSLNWLLYPPEAAPHQPMRGILCSAEDCSAARRRAWRSSVGAGAGAGEGEGEGCVGGGVSGAGCGASTMLMLVTTVLPPTTLVGRAGAGAGVVAGW
ncbi:hypothetical protein QBC39DRAFT_347378, partial [Podospora conica]